MRLPINKLKVGMEVVHAVTDSSGRILVAGGAVLTQRHLDAFAAWEVLSVAVFGEDETTPLRELTRKELATFDRRFSHLDREHPFGAELYKKCLERERRNLARAGEC